MFLFNLICLKILSYFYFIECSDVEYQTLIKKPINNLTLSKGSKFIVKTKITQILPSKIESLNDNMKYCILPLFANNTYHYNNLNEALIASYDQRYFVPKDTTITHNSEKLKLLEDVEIKLNSCSIEVDDYTYIYTVGKSAIVTTHNDGNQKQRLKKQLYDIPTIMNKKIVLNISNGNIYIDKSVIRKSKDFGLLRNLKDSSTHQHSYTVELVGFSCKDSEKNKILYSGDGAILLKNEIEDYLVQFYTNLQVPLVFEVYVDATIKDVMNFNILNEFKVKVKKESEPKKSKTPEEPIAAETPKTPLKPAKSLTDDKNEGSSEKMSKKKLSVILFFTVVFIILIFIMIVTYYWRKNQSY